MTQQSLDTLFDQYQQPLLFVVPVDADQVATLSQLIVQNTPYGKPDQNSAILWINSTLETIGIEVSRKITTELSFSPFDSNTRIISIVGFEFATIEAQNALLKLFESQPNQSQFWLITQNLSRVLPTIQSRCMVYQVPQNMIVFQDTNSSELAQLFTQITTSSVKDCITLAGNYTDRAAALTVLQSLITWITQQTEFVPTSHQLLQLQTGLTRLDQNTNTKLALESAFFGLSSAKDHF